MKTLADDLKSLWGYRSLCLSMSLRDIQSRNIGTAAGFLWLYIPPILTIATYYLIFDIVFQMRLGDNAPAKTVGTYMIAGMLPWIAFSDSISRGMNSLIDAGSFIQKNPLPPSLFLTKTVIANQIIYFPLLLTLWIAYIKIHHAPLLASLSFLLLAISQFMIVWLLSYILAIFSAAIKDTIQIIGFLLSIGVFLSPVLFPVSMFPADFQWLLWINPMTPHILGYQDILLQGQIPSSQTWIGIIAWMAVLSIILNTSIKRTKDQLIDWL